MYSLSFSIFDDGKMSHSRSYFLHYTTETNIKTHIYNFTTTKKQTLIIKINFILLLFSLM